MVYYLKVLVAGGLLATSSTIYALNTFSTPEKSTFERLSSYQVATNNLETQTNRQALDIRDSTQEVSGLALPNSELNGPSSPSISRPQVRHLSEAQKYKERFENPELCREVLSYKTDKSKVLVCRTSKDSSEVEFEYHNGKIGEMPISIKDLRFTYSELMVNLSKADSDGLSSKILDLSTEILAGRGIIPLTNVGNKAFTSEQCKLEVTDRTGEQKNDWKVNCQVTPK